MVATQQYSFEEAYGIVETLEKAVNHMPYHEDYVNFNYDVRALALALKDDAEADMRRLKIRPFAVANIAVLRERRKRAGQPAIISQNWEEGNSTLFENKF